MSVRTIGTVLALWLAAQSAPVAQGPAARFFPRATLMDVGAYYYPEQWPREQWARDLNRMAALGFTFTHFAEFAWTYLEPEEGRFDFAWLDEAIDLAHRAGLRVILCTPSAAPPAWMADRHPEILLTGADGRRREHGTRANNSLSNPRYLAYVDRVVTELARRYGQDPRVWGWQIDNEPESFPDYGPSARTAFQAWLRTRYGTIEELNQSWGGSFWSLRYTDFAQVGIPNPTMTGEDKLSPHALLDFQRFTADTQAAFLDRQAGILRRHVRAEQWITSNFTNATQTSDPRRTRALDFPSFTMYLVAGANFLGGPTFRYGNPYRLMEAGAYFRPIAGVTGVMELQPGQINWATTNPRPEPGAVHMWVWHAFAGGSSFVCTYRYRQPRVGSEMYHEGIVGLDGETLSQGGSEFVRALGELQAVRAAFDPAAVMPRELAARRTALLWSHDNLWDLDLQPQGEHWSTWRHRNTYSTAVKSTGAPLDFIGENDDFSRYPFVVAPAYQMASPALVEKWTRYVEGGGHLVLTTRTAQKDADGHFPEVPLGRRLESLTGARLEAIDTLPGDSRGTVRMAADAYSWQAWAEVLRPQPGTTSLVEHADQYYAGASAAVTRRMGKGSVTYIGVDTMDGALERRLVRQVYERAGVTIDDLPPGVYHDWRDGFHVAVNYSAAPVRLALAPDSRVLVGANPLAPAAALVWKDPEPR